MSEDLALVILAVRDLERSRTFYDRAFGWDVEVDVPVYVEYRLPSGMRVGLYEREAFGRNTRRPPFALPEGELAPTELYLRADDPQDACGRLESAGAELLSPFSMRDWGDEAAYYSDPDGNVIVVSVPQPPGRNASPVSTM